MNRPPYPPRTAEAVVLDLRRDAPPPPGGVAIGGDELRITVDPVEPGGPAQPPDQRATTESNHPLQLEMDEPLPLGLRRVSLQRLDAAVTGLRASVDPDAVLLDLERTRALLRVVRTWIGDDVYRTEDAVLSHAIAALDAVTLASARVAAARATAPGVLNEAETAHLGWGLERGLEDAQTRTVRNRQYVTDLVMTVSTCRSRFASWPVHPGLTDESRRRVPIPDAFSSIAGGLEQSYRSGREALEEAAEGPDPPRLLRWRVEARYLEHQLELMYRAWPEVLGGVIDTLGDLVEILRRERSLADLAWMVTTPPSPLADEAAQHTLVLELERRRYRLRRRAFDLGRRIYLEEPEAFLGRVGGYWTAWRRRRV